MLNGTYYLYGFVKILMTYCRVANTIVSFRCRSDHRCTA